MFSGSFPSSLIHFKRKLATKGLNQDEHRFRLGRSTDGGPANLVHVPAHDRLGCPFKLG
jgi:hypothetical protein